MAETRTGVIAEVEWSEEESRQDLYRFARDYEVPGVNSKSKKEDIVIALVAASTTTEEPVAEPIVEESAAEPIVEESAAAPIVEESVAAPVAAPPPPPPAAPAVSPAEAFRRQVEARRKKR